MDSPQHPNHSPDFRNSDTFRRHREGSHSSRSTNPNLYGLGDGPRPWSWAEYDDTVLPTRTRYLSPMNPTFEESDEEEPFFDAVQSPIASRPPSMKTGEPASALAALPANSMWQQSPSAQIQMGVASETTFPMVGTAWHFISPAERPFLFDNPTTRRTRQPTTLAKAVTRKPLPPVHPSTQAKVLSRNVAIETNSPSNTAFTKPDVMYSIVCESCGHGGRDVYFCNVCSLTLCSRCWDAQMPHRKNKVGPGGIPHEKTQAAVAEKVRNALMPPVDERVREQLYAADEVTAWFGIRRPDNNEPPLLQDYGRFADIMASTDPIRSGTGSSFLPNIAHVGRDTRTPSLVSFVGQTGAGKSTLIKLLVDLNTKEEENYATPVVGAPGVHIPTSGDVHLYLDPRTAYSEAPILYADCEGLEAGERDPVGAVFRMKRHRETAGAIDNDRGLRAARIVSERELTWADSQSTRSREFAVANLYPRLLYTFSDVIVFVLKNPRVVESVFVRLADWAAAALEMSSNQPVLPHVIIALNASENDIDSSLWDVGTVTDSVLDSLARTVNQNETFKKYAQFWRERNKTIDDIGQLILMYYSSVQIIRIPAEGRPNLIEKQATKLYKAIKVASGAARDRKSYLRMLLDAEELHSYLQYAFDHFADTLSNPFDFVQASFTNSPIPLDFGGSILKLAINFVKVWQSQYDAGTLFDRLFEELGNMVASCMMFDSARHKIKGAVDQIFPQYLEHLDVALENFCDRHWPCEYVSFGGERCVNVRSGHSKGHQLKNGKVFAVGEFCSSFSFESYHEEFRVKVYFRLKELLDFLQQRIINGDQGDKVAAEIHRDVMAKFYRRVKSGDRISDLYNSQTACFCCLFEAPEHALPCGHILCTSCVEAYGQRRGNTVIVMHDCPIESGETSRIQYWQITLKPKSAGIRVLTLDGGGIRGIVELEVLRHIEQALGVQLPIQRFFDLIVGTSTGGLIALGLGAMDWSVDECIDRFEQLCHKAFTRRSGGNIPLVGWLVDNYHHSMYETGSLEEALKSAFPEDQCLFGGCRRASTINSPVKVAVTATSVASGTPVVLANYNRQCNQKGSYYFQRPEKADDELRVWEAARATSAAPRFFKSFHHVRSNKTYVDGAVNHNNPIRIAEWERKLIWPDLEDEYPDILLSIGTAYSAQLHRQESEKGAAPRLGVVSHGRSLIRIARNHIATSLDCERIMNDFLAGLPRSAQWSRFVRINPELNGDVPSLDNVSGMRLLRERVRERLSKNIQMREQIHKVATRLVASCFFLEMKSTFTEDADNSFAACAKILCRIPQESREMRELGKYLRQKSDDVFSPFFTIQEQGIKGGGVQKFSLSRDIIECMISYGKFSMTQVKIRLQNRLASTDVSLWLDNSECFLISGFPRKLLEQDKETSSFRRPLAASSNRWAGRSRSSQLRRLKWEPPNTDSREQRQAPAKPRWIDPSASPWPPSSGYSKNMTYNTIQNPNAGQIVAPKTTSSASPTGRAAVLRSAFRALARPRIRSQPVSRPNMAPIHAEGGVDQLPEVFGYYAPKTEFNLAINSVYQEWRGLEGTSSSPKARVEVVAEMPDTATQQIYELPEGGSPSQERRVSDSSPFRSPVSRDISPAPRADINPLQSTRGNLSSISSGPPVSLDDVIERSDTGSPRPHYVSGFREHVADPDEETSSPSVDSMPQAFQ